MFKASIDRLERRRNYERKVRAIDADRGHRVRWKSITIAYLAEIAIIIASLYGQWLLSRRYDHGDMAALALMMMAPITYAVSDALAPASSAEASRRCSASGPTRASAEIRSSHAMRA